MIDLFSELEYERKGFRVRVKGSPDQVIETAARLTGFFNTTNEVNPTLSTYRVKAEDQTAAVLAEIERLGKASPSQVGRAFVSVPLTSIRRAMTVLTWRGLLVKLDERVVGAYGRNEHVWAIASPAA